MSKEHNQENKKSVIEELKKQQKIREEGFEKIQKKSGGSGSKSN